MTKLKNKTLKELWQENKLFIKNRKNKETFEAMKKMYSDSPPYLIESQEGGDFFEINKWQDLKKTPFKYLYNDSDRLLYEDAIILEPEELLNQTK